METLQKRIERILKDKGWSQRRLALEAGLSERFVLTLMTRIREKKDPKMKYDSAEAIARCAGVSVSWLLTGHGPMRPGEPEPSSERPVFRNRPEWNDVVEQVLQKHKVLRDRPQAVEAAGDTAALLIEGPITPEMVADAAMYWLRHADPDRLEALEMDHIKSLTAREEAEEEMATKLYHEARARGENPPAIHEIRRRLRDATKRI